jgi:peptidoglycan hydrolase-like protein with peptidoglycan-binding domain
MTISGVIVLAVAAVAAAAHGFGGSDGHKSTHSTMPPGTAPVTRTTLTESDTVDGTLGYGSTTTVQSQASGKFTALPQPGSTVERGKTLYTVDDKPVVLLYGSLPMYRSLASTVTGRDVEQFEQNLAALGYRGFTVDETYSAATATAVKKWQRDLGLTQTGTVLTYTGTTRQVSIDLALSKRGLATTGAAVTVKLPDATTVAGTVASIGTVAVTTGEGQSQTTTVRVVVSVADQSGLGPLDEAQVTVTFVASQHKDVLTVPITALLALAEGGYGVQVVEGSTTRIVAVTTGMFAGGRVEISGAGVSTDTVVGVPT